MSGYAWLGVISSSFVATLALASWIVMAIPYFDDAPYLHELKRQRTATLSAGLSIYAVFFVIFLWGALALDQNSSGPLLMFAALIIALPISMLLGTETWDRYDPQGMNRVHATTAVAVATGVGLTEIIALVLLLVAVYQVT